MRVAPIDIAHKTFGKKLYGLDSDEVYDFIKDVADEMEEMARKTKTLEDKIEGQTAAITDYKDREESLKQTLHTASQMSERIQLEAQKESDLILRDARQRADVIIKEARDSLKKMYQEINDLKKSRMQFEAGLKSLVKAHVAMIEQGYTVVPTPEFKNPMANEEENPAQQELIPTPPPINNTLTL